MAKTATTKRRGPGEGTIRKRSDGRWEGRVNLGCEGGRRKWKYVYGKTWRAVSDQLKVDLHAQQ